MFFVRADGNAQIGAGHLMRCLTVVDALAQITGTKENILFLCADEASADLAKSKGYAAKSMGTDYRDMESELPFWKEFFEDNEKNVEQNVEKNAERNAKQNDNQEKHTILVDSYHVTEPYLREIRQYGTLFLMDDMQQQCYPVDAVVNYNVFAKEDTYRQLYGDCHVRYCIGSRYVPIRTQFTNVDYCVKEAVTDILITTGGGDSDNIAGKIFQKIYDDRYDYHLITGRFNPHLKELEQLASACRNLHIYHDVENMAELMCRCDIAVTAGGTTIYELAAIGVPFVCFSYAENQELLTNYIGQHDIAGFAGAYHKNPQQTLEKMKKIVNEMAESKEKRGVCHDREKQLIDGRGAERLAREMLAGTDNSYL